MSDMLLGKEVSGTPVETRAGTKAFSTFLQNMMSGGQAGLSQLGTDSLMSLLAIPQIASLLASPTDRTAGLFAAMEPFERRQTADQVAGVRSIFGTAGGRFGRNVASAEAVTRGELGNQFARAREEALLNAAGQNQNFLASLLQSSQQGGLGQLQVMADFFRGGAPQFQQGILPGLLSAGTSLYLGKTLFGNQQPPTGATVGGQTMVDNPWFNQLFQPRLAPIPPVSAVPVGITPYGGYPRIMGR